MFWVILGAVVLALLLITFIPYRFQITRVRKKVLEESKILKTEYGDIEYCIQGEGPPVLLLHGAGGGYDQGLFFGRTALGSGYQYISVSRFGYLQSPFVEDSTIKGQAAIIKALLDKLKIKKVIVLGASAGGPSALQFAHDYPETSVSLILISAISMFMGDDIPASTKFVNAIQKYDFTYWLFNKLFKRLFLDMVSISAKARKGLYADEKAAIFEMVNIMHPMSNRFPGGIHDNYKIRPLSSEEMAEITVPTLILHAKNDMLVKYKHAQFVHDNIKQSVFLSYDTPGHGLLCMREVKEPIKRHIEKSMLTAQ